MPGPTAMQCSRTYPLTADEAFDALLSTPLEVLFNRRYGPIPAIRAVEQPDGAWGTLGQSRVVRLADGGSMREELTRVNRPHAFGYVLTDVTGPMKPLAARVD